MFWGFSVILCCEYSIVNEFSAMLMLGCVRYVIDSRMPYDSFGLRSLGHSMVLMEVGMPFDRLWMTSLYESLT